MKKSIDSRRRRVEGAVASQARPHDVNPAPRKREPVTCEVAILGAGVCGLNAAFVASEYLQPGQRIVIIDRRDRPGGMWNDTYSYVRLHQPHPLFTAGDIPWTLGKERSYLANRDEVLAHLQHCLDVIATKAEVDTRWGWEAIGHEEVDGRVVITARDAVGVEHQIVTDRYIKALGFDVEMNDPLPLSSSRVRSACPSDIAPGCELLGDSAPVWVVGSGKTAMDTIHHILAQSPGREVNVLAGGGTYFTRRETSLPTGLRRWYGGLRTNRIFTQVARRFDGTNAEEVRRWFLEKVAVSLVDDPRHNLAGILSDAEARLVRDGVTRTVRDHLVDVVDEAADEQDGAVMLLRTGRREPIAADSWVVNCTGLLDAHELEYEPYLSESGAVLSINTTSTTFGFSTFSAYFLTHLLFQGTLAQAPLIEVDWNDVQRKAKAALPAITSTVLIHNLSVVYEMGGARIFQRCGLDFDRWYPKPRLLAAQLQFMLRHKRDRAHAAKTLTVAREHFGVRMGLRGELHAPGS